MDILFNQKQSWVTSIRSRLNLQHEEIKLLLSFIQKCCVLQNNHFIIPIFSQQNELYKLFTIHRLGISSVLDSLQFNPNIKSFLKHRLEYEYEQLLASLNMIYSFSSCKHLLQEEIYILHNLSITNREQNTCSCNSCNPLSPTYIPLIEEYNKLDTRSIFPPIPIIPLNIPNNYINIEEQHRQQTEEDTIINIEIDIDNSEMENNVTITNAEEENDASDADIDFIYSDDENLENLEDVRVCIPIEKYNDLIQFYIIGDKPTNMASHCSICLEELCMYDDSETTHTIHWKNMIVNTPCGHWFHDSCLKNQMCIIGPAKCPNCRTEIR